MVQTTLKLFLDLYLAKFLDKQNYFFLIIINSSYFSFSYFIKILLYLNIYTQIQNVSVRTSILKCICMCQNSNYT